MSWPLPARTGAAKWPRPKPSSVTSSGSDSSKPLTLNQPNHVSSFISDSQRLTPATSRSSVLNNEPSTPASSLMAPKQLTAAIRFDRPFSHYVDRPLGHRKRYSQADSVASGMTVSSDEGLAKQAHSESMPPVRHQHVSDSSQTRCGHGDFVRNEPISDPAEKTPSPKRGPARPDSFRYRHRRSVSDVPVPDMKRTSQSFGIDGFPHAVERLGESGQSFPPRVPLVPEWNPKLRDHQMRKRSSSMPQETHQTPVLQPDRTLPGDLNEARDALMVMWLYQQQLQKQYADGNEEGEGVVLKINRDNFACCPASLKDEIGGLYDAARQMNVRCTMTVNTIITRAFVEILQRQQLGSVPLEGGLQVQMLKSLRDLPGCQLHHFAAFVQDKQLLVVWDDDPKAIFDRAQSLEARAMALVWQSEQRNSPVSAADDDQVGDKKPKHTQQEFGTGLEAPKIDVEAANESQDRPVQLLSCCMVALSLVLCIGTMGIGWRILARDSRVDGDWRRMGLIAIAPPTFFFSFYFFYSLVSNAFMIFGSSSIVKSNSKYYSGLRPRCSAALWKGRCLPHVTIQMPVYREGLKTVIKPTIMSLKAAISTYEMQGGTANIFVNDDGLQLLSAGRAQDRRDFYDEHNIGWVARPPHNPRPPPLSWWEPLLRRARGGQAVADKREPGVDEKGASYFVRRGKFKKASNMNHALHLSNRVNDKLERLQRPPSEWSAAHEEAAYRKCLAETLQEDQCHTWAGGNVRMGDFILLVDSDTRVPVDFLLDAVTEMDLSPDVAILQYTSGVLQLTESYFEKGMTWFANLIYTAITFAVASGDCCPFVGHNALLRWSAIQDAAAYLDEGCEKYWSESHVSEDFDMAIRLQMAGWSLRYISYTGTAKTAMGSPDAPAPPPSSFAEGVSLTVYDELARWEKYAYGCSELMFRPLREWPLRGPLTRRFVDFVLSPRIRLPVKLTVVSYMGTYYAIAIAWLIALFNYLFMGWFAGLHRSFYLDSFAIYISLLLVFPCMGNIALATHRYRLGEERIMASLWQNLKWVPMFTIFLGGISLHLSQAVAAHLLGVDMTWGSTAKEVEHVPFVDEAARIARRFRWTFALVGFAAAALVSCRFLLPREWQITEFFAIYPLAVVISCHFALPLLLNPALMTFTW